MTDFEKGRLVNSAIHAATPGAYRKRRRKSFTDAPQEEVDKCLNCCLGECCNCMASTGERQTMVDKLKEVMFFLNMKVNINDACKAVGISRNTYYKLMSK